MLKNGERDGRMRQRGPASTCAQSLLLQRRRGHEALGRSRHHRRQSDQHGYDNALVFRPGLDGFAQLDPAHDFPTGLRRPGRARRAHFCTGKCAFQWFYQECHAQARANWIGLRQNSGHDSNDLCIGREAANCLFGEGNTAVDADFKDTAAGAPQGHLRIRSGVSDEGRRRTGARLIVSLAAVLNFDAHRHHPFARAPQY